MYNDVEIPFSWTCPECKHFQTDTVNPIYGPFVTVTCGACTKVFDDTTLAPVDAIAFNEAVDAAETFVGGE